MLTHFQSLFSAKLKLELLFLIYKMYDREIYFLFLTKKKVNNNFYCEKNIFLLFEKNFIDYETFFTRYKNVS